MRAGAFESDSGNRRFIDAAKRCEGESGGDDGGSRLHQNFYREGTGERHAAGWTGDDACDPRVRGRNGYGGGIQTGRGYPNGEAVAVMAGADERGIRRRVAGIAPVSVWREWNVGRYR